MRTLAAFLSVVALLLGAPARGTELTAADAAAWLDGLMPTTIARADIAGAVVAIVKDGQVLVARGYGMADVAAQRPMDPAATLTRVGSVSKLFVWTAVMQQVEQGRLDLDKDVNAYLDFRLPDAFGRPITLRNLMTHTAGFEETNRNQKFVDPAKLRPLGQALRAVPRRIFPPGEVAAYSNYGTALAAYVVQRVAGVPYEDYVQAHLLTPLGMTRSSFAQPPPPALQESLSRGYKLGSGAPYPFEVGQLWPAGSLSSTALDMAKFLIAQLGGGEVQLLQPETRHLMQTSAFRPVPDQPGVALGWFEMPRNGHRMLEHGGDTALFHTDVTLLPDDGIGIFVSWNSSGVDGATIPLRFGLADAFMDRYFPAKAPPEEPTVAVDTAKLTGSYLISRRSETNFLSIGNLLRQATVSADKDGVLEVDFITGLDGQPRKWRAVAPHSFREVHGSRRLTFATDADGRVTQLFTSGFPMAFVLQPADWTVRGPLMPALLGVTLLTLAVGVVVGLVRRAWLIALVCVVDLAVLVAWLVIAIVGRLEWYDDALDPALRLLQLGALLGVIGLVPVVATVRRHAGWSVVALACVASVWFTVAFHLFRLDLQY